MEDTVSKLLLFDCLVYKHSILQKQKCFKWTGLCHNDTLCNHIFCGSRAEFYICPLTHETSDDLDIMEYWANEIAFIDDVPKIPENHLQDVHDQIQCYRLESYPAYPGFVRVRYTGVLIYMWVKKKYEFLKWNGQKFHNDSRKSYRFPPTTQPKILEKNVFGSTISSCLPQGPAERQVCSANQNLRMDFIPSLWCPQWPPEATEWISRTRLNGWPTEERRDEIIKGGCHVVRAKHRNCRDDIFQRRYSFSAAEVLLLQSWTPIQQTVYHLIRFFAKKELFDKDCPKDREILSTYHLKTLMLWTCEEKEPDWWKPLSLVQLCCSMLQKLSNWLQKQYFPNYFIRHASLFNFNLEEETKTAIKTLCIFSDSNILGQWFLSFYVDSILWCFCEENIPFDLIFFNKNVQDSLDKSLSILDSDLSFVYAEAFTTAIFARGFNKKFLRDGVGELEVFMCLKSFSIAVPRNPNRCLNYASAVFLLFAVNLLKFKQSHYYEERLVDLLQTVALGFRTNKVRCHSFPDPYRWRLEKSFVYFLRAHELMEALTGPSDELQFQLMSGISIALLHECLKSKDSQACATRCPALVYIAALCYASSKYETSAELCALAISHSRQEVQRNWQIKKTETLNAVCLLFIDDVANITGFLQLCKHFLQKISLGINHINEDLRVSPEVFAQYLINSICEKSYNQLLLTTGKQNIPKKRDKELNSQFLLDSLIILVSRRKRLLLSRVKDGHFNQPKVCVYRRSDGPVAEAQPLTHQLCPNDDDICSLLMEWSLQKLSSFYCNINRDSGINCSTVDCYRALFFYTRRRYEDVLCICETILSTPDFDNGMIKFAVANVMVLPPFDVFF